MTTTTMTQLHVYLTQLHVYSGYVPLPTGDNNNTNATSVSFESRTVYGMYKLRSRVSIGRISLTSPWRCSVLVRTEEKEIITDTAMFI